MGDEAADKPMWLDFLWLEVTNRCNLQCVHCYSDSHPESGYRDLLTREHYEKVLTDAFELGCRKVQLIGGEPQMSPHFGHLLRMAKDTGYEFVEVFSNLTHLTDETIGYAAENGIRFATSVYSDDPEVHDRITKVRSSHRRTVRNISRLVERDIPLRAAVITIDQGEVEADRTKDFLKGLGVDTVRLGEMREFGRAQEVMSQSSQLSGLCGNCWRGQLCVSPDGMVYPCVMARDWPVGNILEQDLSQILRDGLLDRTRRTIREEVWIPRLQAHANAEDRCSPAKTCPQNCTPDVPCPQSCTPDHPMCAPDFCNPFFCPQSCEPFPEEH
ncbi:MULTISPECIES: radical SAM/SPASM domain-containing protein [unclassified Streptomyces]|uniref:radical SAM/SPASM domain-containing protein n=1 Tax=unclassified Streptomyces TaxID=2593676 RepID=UPI002E224FBF|nr:radical SAM protein [Streptomyces sp. NBC_01023]